MAVERKSYALPPTPLIPNSPHVLIHYPKLLRSVVSAPSFNPTQIFDLFAKNGWQSQWIARYGPTQDSHYHSTAHECMVVISGEGATIRFGVADVADSDHEEGGVEIQASLGDVFILPAGTAHKTHKPRPDAPNLKFMVPKDVQDADASRAFFSKIGMDGDFMMMGAYPHGGVWDFLVGGEHKGRFEEVWNVPIPNADPVLGTSPQGLRGLWGENDTVERRDAQARPRSKL